MGKAINIWGAVGVVEPGTEGGDGGEAGPATRPPSRAQHPNGGEVALMVLASNEGGGGAGRRTQNGTHNGRA